MFDTLIEAKASHYLSPVRSDTLPENTRYKDDGCDVFYSCLGCPLAKCRYDDPGFLQRENRRSRDQEIFRLRQQKVSVVNIAKKFGYERKIKIIELSTGINNKNAQLLYESLEYKRDKEYYNYFLEL